MRETIKSHFRTYAGYDSRNVCGDCKHCELHRCGSRNHYKCKKMGISSSPATDIRKKDIACNFFEKDDIEMKCKYCVDEICVNADSPILADYCIVCGENVFFEGAEKMFCKYFEEAKE